VGNPYGPPVDHMDCSTAADDAHVERQISPAGGDDVEQGDDPHETIQPESEDITQTDSEDIAQPDAPDFPELKEHEDWTIGMFRKKQSLVLILVIWPSPKKIRALVIARLQGHIQ
jgi:hypothetical protein